MATSVLLACGLNETKLRPYIYLSEENGVDGSFLISSILGQRQRVTATATILVCLHQNFAHYCNAGLRLGYNLQIAEGKTLRVIDILGDVANDFEKSKWTTVATAAATTTTTTHSTNSNLVQILWDEIRLQSSELLQTKSTITIIIDDLSALLNLGASRNDVMRFCYRLKRWANGFEDEAEGSNNSSGSGDGDGSGSSDGRISIVTKLNSCESFGAMANQISGLCDIHIVLERLKSGNFKEVDGKIVVKDSNGSGSLANLNSEDKVILYKVLERSIKIFNPGEVGIKV